VVAARNAALVAQLKAHPTIAAALTQAQATGTTPTTAQLAAIRAAIGPTAFAELIKPTAAADLAFLSTTAPRTLGAAQFAALSAPTPALTAALGVLAKQGPTVKNASTRSPKQWRTFFLIGAAGELVFIPLILLMAGYWDPRKAKRAAEEHDAWLNAEMAKLGSGQGSATPLERP
jgi:MFS transporter, ACS family, D-galactonate transporter